MISLENRPPPTCQRCGRALPGPDPLTHRTPGKHRRYSTDHQPRSPVRVVVRQGPNEEPSETYRCSSRCFKAAHKKPEKAKKSGKPGRESQFNITHNSPPRAA